MLIGFRYLFYWSHTPEFKSNDCISNTARFIASKINTKLTFFAAAFVFVLCDVHYFGHGIAAKINKMPRRSKISFYKSYKRLFKIVIIIIIIMMIMMMMMMMMMMTTMKMIIRRRRRRKRKEWGTTTAMMIIVFIT